eukprot:6472252-Amphidinium_carterae.1
MERAETVLAQNELLRVFEVDQRSYIVHKESGEVACLGSGTWRLEYSTEGEGMVEQIVEGEEGEIGWARQYIKAVAEVVEEHKESQLVVID